MIIDKLVKAPRGGKKVKMKQYNFDEKLKLYYIDYTSELGTERIYASKEENMQETINAYRSMLQDIRNGKKLKKPYEVL